MIELRFTKPSQLGEVKIVLRIVRHLLYFKYSHSDYAEQAIKQFRAKGIRFRKSPNWLEVDIFGDNKVVKIGDEEIDLEEDKDEAIEKKLSDFYVVQYVKSGFKMVL